MRVAIEAWVVAALLGALVVCPAAAQSAPPAQDEKNVRPSGQAVAGVNRIGADVALLLLALQPEDQETIEERTDITVVEEEVVESAPSPFSVGLEYSIYSDYVFRGINFSEFPGEGRERVNHQLSVDFGVDLGSLLGQDAGSLGTLSFNTWFEWFGGQKKIDPDKGGQNLQEVDYTIAWSYDIEAIATSLTLGYVFYTFPNLDSINTQELQITLEHNDAWMWKWLLPDNEDGVLNPSFFYALDLEAAPGAGWMELGISHDFQVCTNVTMTPSLTLAIDNRWLDPILDTGRQGGTRLAYLQYGLNIAYDLSSGLKLPDELGAITMSGFLFFNEAFGNAESSGLIQDEFFGGMSIGWSF